MRFLLTILSCLAMLCSPALAYPVKFANEGDVPDDLKDTIVDRLPEEPKAESELHARRQARRATKIVTGVLNAYGYFDPVIMRAVDGEGENAAPYLNIDPGPQFVVAELRIRYQGDFAPLSDIQDSTRATLGLQPGQPAVAAEVIDQERQIGAALRTAGYPYAEVTSRDVIGDKDAKTISVRYNVQSGPRVVLGEFVYPDGLRTKDKYLQKINPMESGQIFDPSEMALYNSRLAETRIFERSLAKLSDEPSGTTEDGAQIRDVNMLLTERDRHTLTLGAGFDTAEGFGVDAELLRRNLIGMGDLLIGKARIAEREIGLDVVWRRPNELGYGKGITYFASAFDERTDAFDQQTAKIGLGVEVIKGPQFQYGFGADARYIRQTGATVRRDFQTVSLNGSVQIDRSDSILDPRKGWRASGRVKPTYAISGDGPDVFYTRAVAEGRYYLPLSPEGRYVAAGRARVGTLVGADAINVPGEDRFFAGGGGSVRGYGFQAIGPFDDDDIPLGGRNLAELSFEGRMRVTDSIGAVAFIDAGSVSDEAYPTFGNLRVGAGIGARYMTPAGPIRLDIATPLNPSDRDEVVQVYISIGQAF